MLFNYVFSDCFIIFQLQIQEKQIELISALPEMKENLEPTPGTSMEPPLKKARQEDAIKNLVVEKDKLKYKVKLLSQRLRRRDMKINNLKCALNLIKKKCTNFEEVESVLVNNFSNIHTHMNTRKSDKTVRYSDELKSFALTLYFYSPKAYIFLRNHISLPHPSTLRLLLSTHNCNTGFMKEVFEFLKRSVEKNDYLKNVSIVFDAMSIRSELTYDKKMDKFWGYVDYGGIVNNDSEILATEVLVIMIVSYTRKFKCPIGYFFINKISANIQAQLILTTLRLLADANITVRSLTCDGTITNIKTYELLGCNFNVDDLKTNFKHPTKDCKVHCLLDPPHMIKLARNVFAECKLSSDKGNIDFNYVRNLHTLQEQEGIKLKNKISAVHINFYGKKMNVKLAAQVLSSSVADAIEFLAKSGHKNFVGSEATIEFIRYIDRIFDIFNAKNPFGVGYKAPLRLTNKNFWMNVISETKNYLANLIIDEENILSHRRKTPALGLIIDCVSFKNLIDELLSDDGINMKYFLPYKCSQDHVEIFFSCVRARGGFNDNPSALQFRYIMRKLLFRNSVQPTVSANIIADEGSIQTTPVLEFKYPKRSNSSQANLEVDENIDQLMDQISRTSISDFKDNILYYIAGYITNKLSKKNSCAYCIAALFKLKEQCDHNYAVDICKFSSFTTFIDRGKLKYVTKFAFNIVKYCEKVFLTMCHTNGLKNLNKNRLMLLVVQHFYMSGNMHFDPPHPIESFNCEDSHEIVILKSIASSYLNLRLFSHTKTHNLKIVGQRSTLRQRLHKTILFNNV